MKVNHIEKLKVILQELIIVNNISKSELENIIEDIYKKKERLKNNENKADKNNDLECDFPF